MSILGLEDKEGQGASTVQGGPSARSPALKESFKTFAAVSAFILVCSFVLIKSCNSGPSGPSNPTTPNVGGSAGTQQGANPQSGEDLSKEQEQEEENLLRSCGACPAAAWLHDGRGILGSEILTNSADGNSELVVTIRFADFTDNPALAMEIAILDMGRVLTHEAETGSEGVVYFHVVKEATDLSPESGSGSTSRIGAFDIVYLTGDMRKIDVSNLPGSKVFDMGTVAQTYPLGAAVGRSYCDYGHNRRFTPNFCSNL